eukprot:CAMPEP_0170191682 /NCGR_PEP_ID=MMETSP0040_2-20121228/52295_1 /TAXON_ID=641309 /ORGANISM="Lotharella oceanica, Strain CCMP622" /LENGTH=202 /DNA_ID=CAMNT_0010439829 /DNA_START=1 /DNA_END=609 /DNA_ORIENTATION=+
MALRYTEGRVKKGGKKGRKRKAGGNSEDNDNKNSDNQLECVPRDMARAAVAVVKEWVINDPDHTFDKTRLNRFCNPLVNLLERAVEWSKDDAEYQAFVENELAPCLVAVCAHLEDNNLWKTLNHAVMTKGESPHAKVRYSAVSIIKAFYDKIGEEFLVLLPETVPFISERMEDPDENVESATQELIAMVEKLSGEDLDSYLR